MGFNSGFKRLIYLWRTDVRNYRLKRKKKKSRRTNKRRSSTKKRRKRRNRRRRKRRRRRRRRKRKSVRRKRTYIPGRTRKFTALKVPRQFPLVVLIKEMLWLLPEKHVPCNIQF